MNPRVKRRLQQGLAVGLFLFGILLVIIPFLPIQYPAWWPKIVTDLPADYVPWWPRVIGLAPTSHYSTRLFLTVAFGLTIFIPQVEATFVSLMRQRSPIGAPYVDRKNFTCPACGMVNRPSIQFCVKCGAQISSGTRHWGRPSQGSGKSSVLMILLSVALILAFFIGLFDLTLYSSLIGYLGADATIVLAGTILSAVPSIAGYMALKDGLFRRYSSLKRFDKVVFGTAFWLIFGVLFLLLALLNFFTQPPRLFGQDMVLWMQLIAGILFLLHPALRRLVYSPSTGTQHF